MSYNTNSEYYNFLEGIPSKTEKEINSFLLNEYSNWIKKTEDLIEEIKNKVAGKNIEYIKTEVIRNTKWILCLINHVWKKELD